MLIFHFLQETMFTLRRKQRRDWITLNKTKQNRENPDRVDGKHYGVYEIIDYVPKKDFFVLKGCGRLKGIIIHTIIDDLTINRLIDSPNGEPIYKPDLIGFYVAYRNVRIKFVDGYEGVTIFESGDSTALLKFIKLYDED